MSATTPNMPEQTRLLIPHPDVTPSIDIVGLLAQHTPVAPLPSPTDASYAAVKASTPRRPLAIILHGVLAHKDQTYHKSLVAALSIDSFRFDFRANHETPGEWSMVNLEHDVQDLRAVIVYLKERYGYSVELLVGHSRASLSGWMYFATFADEMRIDEDRIPYWVSVSGRWRMDKIMDRLPKWQAGWATEGFFRWKVKVAGQEREVHLRPEHVESFAKIPVGEYVARFPVESDVLLLHGTTDEVVPTADVGYFANALTGPGRRPGSCKLHLVDDANHNFKGCYPEVVERICTWFDERRALALQTDEAATRAGLPLTAAVDTSALPGEVLERSWKNSTENGEGKGKL